MLTDAYAPAMSRLYHVSPTDIAAMTYCQWRCYRADLDSTAQAAQQRR